MQSCGSQHLPARDTTRRPSQFIWLFLNFTVKGSYMDQSLCLSFYAKNLYSSSQSFTSHQPTKTCHFTSCLFGLVTFHVIMIPFRNVMCPQISTQNPTHVNFRTKIYEIILSGCFVITLKLHCFLAQSICLFFSYSIMFGYEK